MYDELKRLNFEDFIWILFATLAFLNIFGNYNSKEYIITNNGKYKYQSNKSSRRTDAKFKPFAHIAHFRALGG